MLFHNSVKLLYICKDFTSHDSCKARCRLEKQGIIKAKNKIMQMVPGLTTTMI